MLTAATDSISVSITCDASMISIQHICPEPPKGPSDLCPRLNGFYSHPDASVCHIFYACVDGQAEEYTCSSGLWFDEYSGVCNWPEVTDRTECKAEAYGRKKYPRNIFQINVSV